MKRAALTLAICFIFLNGAHAATTNPPAHPINTELDPVRCKGTEERGSCKDNIKRWHYNAATNKCDFFWYSGCGGNDNNWMELGNCENVCVKKPTTQAPTTAKPPTRPNLNELNWDNPIRCIGPEERGPCDDNIERYHYNVDTNTCDKFSYSGCGGNDNNWWYKGNCEKICVDKNIDSGIIFPNGPVQCVATDGTVTTEEAERCPQVTCNKRCMFGFKSDNKGCPTCTCGQSSCN